MAKTNEFGAGDYVVYPTHGVGRVTGIEKQEISGHSLKLIIIKFEKDRMTLRVPVDKAEVSGLRKLSSRKMMDTALATLKGRSRVKRTMWSRRAQEYEAKINSGNPISIAEVVRDLHRDTDQPDRSYSERQLYEAALERLAREFAAVEQIEPDTAAEGRTLDQGHGRFGEPVERAHQARQRARVLQVLFLGITGHALHPAEIRACREALARGGQHDGAHAPVGLHRQKRRRQLRDQRVVEGIVHFGPVEGKASHAVVGDVLQDQGIGHGVPAILWPYIRNRPKRVGAIGALSDAEIARPKVMRVSAGSMMPSSHRRAVA